jgi:DNA integrity scanning protein DisA with diadenylate cyclase activity
MRHRAGIGITEQSDAIAIVVSEETGEISLAHEGQIKLNISPENWKAGW